MAIRTEPTPGGPALNPAPAAEPRWVVMGDIGIQRTFASEADARTAETTMQMLRVLQHRIRAWRTDTDAVFALLREWRARNLALVLDDDSAALAGLTAGQVRDGVAAVEQLDGFLAAEGRDGSLYAFAGGPANGGLR